MLKKKLLFFAVLCILSCQRKHREIIISDHIMDFVAAKEHGLSLIILDIDDTLYQSEKLLGTPNWFYSMCNILRQNGFSKKQAYRYLSQIDYVVQEHLPIKPVENDLLIAIKEWQKKGQMVLAITSRPHKFSPFIENQLLSLGLDFAKESFLCPENYFENGFGKLKNGVLYVGFKAKKSKSVEHFLKNLKKCGIFPKNLSYADDQPRYVEDMLKLSQKYNLGYLGLIYGHAVNKRNFKLEKANSELFELESSLNQKIVPDEIRKYFQF